MTPKIYRYVVKKDAGSAPNPCDEYCTLAICKPGIRRTASEGDWIIGFKKGTSNQVIYVMQVEEKLTFAEYWNDNDRFKLRKPEFSPLSDNIYQPDGIDELRQVPNQVHDHNSDKRDSSGTNVLISKRFWYFGKNAPEFELKLKHLIHKGRGHSVNINRQEPDVEMLIDWLKQQGKKGVHGKPVNLPEGINFSIKNRVASVIAPHYQSNNQSSRSKNCDIC